MKLARLLGRSSPNQAPVGPSYPGPGPPSIFMSGPEQSWGAGGGVMPQPSETQALSVPAFWRAHAYVTATVGMLPVTVYRGTDAVDPQPPVIVQPDPNQTPMAFWAGCVSSLTLYGNSVNLITSTDRGGWPLTLKPIHPTLAAVRFTGNPMAPTVDAWYIAGQMYDPSEVWHIKSHLARAGWPLGRGLIDMDGDAIATAIAMQSYAANYFQSGGMPSGILKIHRPEITQAQADEAKANWVAKYSGAPSPAVMNELTDFTPLAYRPVDSQMVESRQFQLIEIANMWGLPATLVGGTTGSGTYKNAEAEGVQARNDGVAPWTTLLEQAGSIELVPRGQRLLWDLGAVLRTDTLTQYQAYQAALGGPGPQSQWLLPDEIRARENLDPMADVAAELAASSPNIALTEPQPVMPGATATPAIPPVAGGPATPNTFPMPTPAMQDQMEKEPANG